ncbi:MAG: thiamine phosphate synthase [Phycisphaerales bacterium]
MLLTEASCARPWADVLRAVIAGGAVCIQVREKSLGDRDLLARIRAAIEIARPPGAALVLNDRVDLALAPGAAAPSSAARIACTAAAGSAAAHAAAPIAPPRQPRAASSAARAASIPPIARCGTCGNAAR